MTALVQYVFLSTASASLRSDDLHELLGTSIRNNRERDITGILIHHEGDFLMALEGPVDAMQALRRKIGRDSRHDDIVDVVWREVSQRLFPDWYMSFFEECTLTDAERRSYSELKSSLLDMTEQRSGRTWVEPLLVRFRETILRHEQIWLDRHFGMGPARRETHER